MHASAYQTASQFFEVYAATLTTGTVIEIGSQQVAEGQRTLRRLCPPQLNYVGVDLTAGSNVDVVLDDPYVFPLVDGTADIVLCTSVFEHCDFFWELFEEILRVMRPGGLLYINAPSNGYVHRYPVDCWRFYPDSGVALAEWGCRQGHDVALLESFITDEDLSENPEEIWNDFVAVFVKGKAMADRYARRMTDSRNDYANARRPESRGLLRANRFPGRSHAEVTRWLERSSAPQRVRLHQIAYSEETLLSIPACLHPLDNRSNERPDWAEYWPIRRFLLQETLDEETLYGFLSPRLAEKMFFPPDAMVEFAASCADHVDVAAFSPYFDLRAIFRNVFEQAEFFHPGSMDLAKRVVAELLPDVSLDNLVSTSETAIFCNYFAAKPRFWREWLTLCEAVFTMAETPDHPCAAALNREYAYGVETMPAKVFVVERMASLLLATSGKFKVEKFVKSTLSLGFGDLPYALLASLDQLKLQGIKGHPMLLDAFTSIQQGILTTEAARNLRDDSLSRNFALGAGHSPSRGYEHWGSSLPLPPSATSPSVETVGLRWLLKKIVRRRQ